VSDAETEVVSVARKLAVTDSDARKVSVDEGTSEAVADRVIDALRVSDTVSRSVVDNDPSCESVRSETVRDTVAELDDDGESDKVSCKDTVRLIVTVFSAVLETR